MSKTLQLQAPKETTASAVPPPSAEPSPPTQALEDALQAEQQKQEQELAAASLSVKAFLSRGAHSSYTIGSPNASLLLTCSENVHADGITEAGQSFYSGKHSNSRMQISVMSIYQPCCTGQKDREIMLMLMVSCRPARGSQEQQRVSSTLVALSSALPEDARSYDKHGTAACCPTIGMGQGCGCYPAELCRAGAKV